ncbi:MAG: hypothetical protein IJY29_03830 [Ruminococcus sp.]|nr:hypothetical protein [Ruminococcus sp.]
MNKNKWIVLVLVLVVSGFFTFVAFEDAKLVFDDKRIDINETSTNDFSSRAVAEGEAYIITGPFAELEEKNTVYGIPVGKKSTYYYLVSNTDYETFAKAVDSDTDNFFSEMTWYVASVSDEDMVDKFDKAAERFDRWMQSYNNLWTLFDESGYNPELDEQKIEDMLDQLPDESIKISGFLRNQSSDSKYKKYRDEFLESGNLSSDDIGELLLDVDKEGANTGDTEKMIFFVAAGVFVISFILLILAVVKTIKKKKSQEL